MLGDQTRSRSTLPPGITLLLEGVVVRLAEKSSLSVITFSTTKIAEPEFKPTVSAVFVVL